MAQESVCSVEFSVFGMNQLCRDLFSDPSTSLLCVPVLEATPQRKKEEEPDAAALSVVCAKYQQHPFRPAVFTLALCLSDVGHVHGALLP